MEAFGIDTLIQIGASQLSDKLPQLTGMWADSETKLIARQEFRGGTTILILFWSETIIIVVGDGRASEVNDTTDFYNVLTGDEDKVRVVGDGKFIATISGDMSTADDVIRLIDFYYEDPKLGEDMKLVADKVENEIIDLKKMHGNKGFTVCIVGFLYGKVFSRVIGLPVSGSMKVRVGSGKSEREVWLMGDGDGAQYALTHFLNNIQKSEIIIDTLENAIEKMLECLTVSCALDRATGGLSRVATATRGKTVKVENHGHGIKNMDRFSQQLKEYFSKCILVESLKMNPKDAIIEEKLQQSVKERLKGCNSINIIGATIIKKVNHVYRLFHLGSEGDRDTAFATLGTAGEDLETNNTEVCVVKYSKPNFKNLAPHFLGVRRGGNFL